jgi:coproporphyrinogen III oxidase-like Fe-S oxidoreductase
MPTGGPETGRSQKARAAATPSAKDLAFYLRTGNLPLKYRQKVGSGKPDGRSARAEIVRKVMAEKGMKMIEASKYVKAHNLY